MSNVHAQGLAYTVYVYIHEVQTSDIKKVVQWFNILVKNELLDLLDEEEAACG